jgi:hypothetical protein
MQARYPYAREGLRLLPPLFCSCYVTLAAFFLQLVYPIAPFYRVSYLSSTPFLGVNSVNLGAIVPHCLTMALQVVSDIGFYKVLTGSKA